MKNIDLKVIKISVDTQRIMNFLDKAFLFILAFIFMCCVIFGLAMQLIEHPLVGYCVLGAFSIFMGLLFAKEVVENFERQEQEKKEKIIK